MNVFKRRQKTRLNKKRVKDIKKGRRTGRRKAWKKSRKTVQTEKKQKYVIKK